MRTLTIAIALLTSSACFVGNAHADPAADAEAQFRIGVALQRVDDFDAAITAYEASLSLHPTKSALFNLANCLKAAHRYPDALAAFENLRTRHGAELDEGMRRAADEQIQALEHLVGGLALEVVPEGAEVFVDGRSLGRSPLSPALSLAVGPHDVEARLDGFQSQQMRVEVVSGITAAQRLVLVASPPPAALPQGSGGMPPVPARPPSLKPPASKPADLIKTLGWVSTGVGAAFVLGSAATGIWALALDRSLEDDCPRGHCPAARAADIDRLATLVTTTNILGGLGCALAAVGITFLALPSTPDTPQHDAAGPEALARQRVAMRDQEIVQLRFGLGQGLVGAELWSEF